MDVHDGVALIFEMPHNGRVAKPKAKSTMAIRIKIISTFETLSENFLYRTAHITPRIVMDEFEAFPRPIEPIQCLIEPVKSG